MFSCSGSAPWGGSGTYTTFMNLWTSYIHLSCHNAMFSLAKNATLARLEMVKDAV